ncbi:fumarylacetoacetate hydrolase family protein [Microbacterium lushaniae]|nr:fumarylacetoacetate hydrolase family protein [Microbacterium lushaniae]KAA9158317.1 fumarylacetoacetate hydrolase family protein [Microbacterium lushaniae]
MRFARVGEPGAEKPVVVQGDALFDLTPLTADIDGAFLADPSARARVAVALADGTLPRLPADGSRRFGPPIARPHALLCIGLNYAAHAAESGAASPTEPILFLKTPNTLCGPNDDLVLPPGSRKTDWEVELGVVIGAPAYRLKDPSDAWAHIAGYVLVDDVSEREYQLERPGGQWSKGKISPGFTPAGPYLVTADEVDPGNLGIRSRVNGEVRQDSTTADLIFPVDYLVWHLSQYVRLEAGDLVLTGTPEGVALSGRFPYLADGDRVEVEIDGLGAQSRRVVAGTDD